MADAERTVRSKVLSYWHPDGSFRMATRGQIVTVAAADLPRFDVLDGAAPARAADPKVAIAKEPPRGGPQATKAAWAAYAELRGLEVTDDMSRDQIVAAVDAAGIVEGE